EDVDRHLPGQAGAADVATEVLAPEGEVDLGKAAAGLADHHLCPLLAELVAEAVEEDVGLLVHGQRPEELRVGAPEDRLRPPRGESGGRPSAGRRCRAPSRRPRPRGSTGSARSATRATRPAGRGTA